MLLYHFSSPGSASNSVTGESEIPTLGAFNETLSSDRNCVREPFTCTVPQSKRRFTPAVMRMVRVSSRGSIERVSMNDVDDAKSPDTWRFVRSSGRHELPVLIVNSRLFSRQ